MVSQLVLRISLSSMYFHFIDEETSLETLSCLLAVTHLGGE